MPDGRPPLREARRLLRRYLDPARSWDATREQRLRQLVREHEACATAYDRAVAQHRLLVGGDPGLPSGFEQQRMMAALMPVPAQTARAGGRRLALAGSLAAALAAVLLFTVGPFGAPAPETEWIQARGLPASLFPERLTGFGISGVTEGGVEYEVIAAEEAFLGDWVRFTYSNERPELRWLFIVGLQSGRQSDQQLVWLAPLPEERESLPIRFGRYLQLDFEIRLAKRHQTGPWRVVALFTERPLTTDEVARALDSRAAGLLPSEIPEALSRRLRLSDSAVIQVLETRIVRGSQLEEDSP